jgi:hypothetical protein
MFPVAPAECGYAATDADSVDCDQPFRPIMITCHGDQNHAVHHARRMRGGRLWWLLVVATDG